MSVASTKGWIKVTREELRDMVKLREAIRGNLERSMEMSEGAAAGAGKVAGQTTDAAQQVANSAIDAAENVVKHAADMGLDAAREVMSALIRAQQRLVDEVLGKE
jgi:hypothetical protein